MLPMVQEINVHPLDSSDLVTRALSSLALPTVTFHIKHALTIEPVLPRLSQLRHLSLKGSFFSSSDPPLARLPTLPASVHTLTLNTLGRNTGAVSSLSATAFAGFSSPTLRTLVLPTDPVPPSIYLELLSEYTVLRALEVLDMRSVRAYEGPDWDETATKLLEAGEERGIGVLLPRARAYPFYESPGPYDL
ncbi:hypothetical protein JCM8097_003028 [Rhodosporidiobolus ruineniae]